MKDILDSIESSQHCQRNWDLSKNIDPEHIRIFEEVVKNVPSKQNIAYYKVHFITNRNIIEQIYHWTMTESRGDSFDFYNPQVLANLLVAFEDHYDINDTRSAIERNKTTIDYNGYTIHVDRHQAIGIAAGVLAFTANHLGYKTGFCKCFKPEHVNPILNAKYVSLLMGIGIPKTDTPHTQHHYLRNSNLKPIKKANIPIIHLD